MLSVVIVMSNQFPMQVEVQVLMMFVVVAVVVVDRPYWLPSDLSLSF